MASKVIKTRVKNKHDVESNWNKAVNFVPLDGEQILYDPDDDHTETRIKFGDGVTNVINLPFFDDDITVDEINALWNSDVQSAEEVAF